MSLTPTTRHKTWDLTIHTLLGMPWSSCASRPSRGAIYTLSEPPLVQNVSISIYGKTPSSAGIERSMSIENAAIQVLGQAHASRVMIIRASRRTDLRTYLERSTCHKTATRRIRNLAFRCSEKLFVPPSLTRWVVTLTPAYSPKYLNKFIYKGESRSSTSFRGHDCMHSFIQLIAMLHSLLLQIVSCGQG